MLFTRNSLQIQLHRLKVKGFKNRYTVQTVTFRKAAIFNTHIHTYTDNSPQTE